MGVVVVRLVVRRRIVYIAEYVILLVPAQSAVLQYKVFFAYFAHGSVSEHLWRARTCALDLVC